MAAHAGTYDDRRLLAARSCATTPLLQAERREAQELLRARLAAIGRMRTDAEAARAQQRAHRKAEEEARAAAEQEVRIRRCVHRHWRSRPHPVSAPYAAPGCVSPHSRGPLRAGAGGQGRRGRAARCRGGGGGGAGVLPRRSPQRRGGSFDDWRGHGNTRHFSSLSIILFRRPGARSSSSRARSAACAACRRRQRRLRSSWQP